MKVGIGVTIAVAIGIAVGTLVQPANGATCNVSNRASWNLAGTNCIAGTTITVTDGEWQCDRRVSEYGPLPIRVRFVWTQAVDGNAASFNSGCEGDGNSDTVDIIVENQGGGNVTLIGNDADSAKLQPNGWPKDVQITGNFDCGAQVMWPPPTEEPHSDAFQFQGGVNVTIVNGTSGDYDAGTSTCQGAGGAVFYSFNTQTNVDVIGGEYVSCHFGLNGANSSPAQGNDVIDAKFRAGRTEARGDGWRPELPGQGRQPVLGR